MRKMINASLFLILLGTLLVSCKKEADFKNSETLSYKLDNIPIINPLEGEVIEVINDDDELKLNKQLFDLANATKDLIKDASFNKIIIELALESNTETVYYSQIKEKSSKYYDIINENLMEIGTSIEQITRNMTHKPILPNPEYPETSEIEIYEPAIVIPNINSMDANRIPVLSPNKEFVYNEEVYILSWYFNEENEVQEIIVGEETANNTTNPIFILNHAVPQSKFIKYRAFLKSISDQSLNQVTTKSTSMYNISKVQIKNGYRYEQGTAKPRAEFSISSIAVKQGSTNYPFYYLYLSYGNNADGSQKIAEVDNSDITSSNIIDVNGFFSSTIENDPSIKVYWNTFERDWNRGLQIFGSGTNFGKNWFVPGKARYAGDWYMWVPSTVYYHEMPYDWFGWEPYVDFISWKSSIRIQPF